MQDTKKVAGELLVELEKKGVTFETVDGKLKYKDSKGNFTENSKEKVKKYKEEIIEILKKKQTIDEFITDNDYETNVYPLTDVQAAYLVGKTEAVKWGGIGCKGYIEVDFGSYSAEELSRAWKVLVNRHEMLRAKVTEVGFEILERDEIDYEIKIVNLQKMAEREKVDTLSKIREDFSEYVFHTEEPPLFKVLITKRIEGNFFHLLDGTVGTIEYGFSHSEMASLCITKASELLGENIIINRIFLINPSKAKESDLYLGDISIIDGNSVAIKSWEKAVLGNVREFESNSNDIFDIIMRELENDK